MEVHAFARRRTGSWASAPVGLLLLTGCLNPSYPNRPLEKYAPREGYRFDALEPGEEVGS